MKNIIKQQPLLAFHSDPKIKAKYLRRVRAHAKADAIVKGQYWDDGKGCAVGCTIHGDNHKSYERELGIPEVLARLEDHIFENLPNDLAKTWPERFLNAPKVGADLSLVWPRLAHWLLVDTERGVIHHANAGIKPAIERVANLYARWIAGEKPADGEWRAAAFSVSNAAASADYVAAYYAAHAAYAAASAAYYAAASAAYYAAHAAYAAASAAYYAAASAAYYAAHAASAAYYAAASAAYYAANAAADGNQHFMVVMSEKLIELMGE